MSPILNNRPNRRWLPLVLMILAVASLGLVACQAAMETKQGDLGEFCNNRDSDCRPGHICQSGVCVLANQRIGDACKQVCDKIKNCGVTEPNCVSDCQRELGGDTVDGNWGDEAVETWSDCVVNDLSCADVGDTANDAAQICYDRLPLDEARVERCRTFLREGRACNSGQAPSNFQSECVYRARTHDEESWSETEDCEEAIEFGDCSEIIGCINTTFSLEGDERF